MAKRGKYHKVNKFAFDGLDVRHYRTTEAYAQAVQTLFDRATADVAAKCANIKPGDDGFSFADYPSAEKYMKKVCKQLSANVTTTITRGSRKEWLFACEKNNEFLESIMDTSKINKATLKKMQDQNLEALKTFQNRKVSGMDLSRRVWSYVDGWKEHLEMALDSGLGEGKSAASLARQVKQDLKYPDKLFRRVRGKDGKLHLSKNAKAFHPGQGVYRSSVKNAQRLTRSEINMAYRESDYLRWQQLDFVVGFEIKRTNHQPKCKCPLCERLQGRYPKTFKFVGWHPQCMCKAIPILMDDETFDANELSELRAALKGEEYHAQQAKNVVTDVPEGFREMMDEMAEKQANWTSTPYFIRDNFKNGMISEGLKIKLPSVDDTGRVTYHKDYDQLSSKEQDAWRKFVDDMIPIDYEWEMACRRYGIEIKTWANSLEQAWDNEEYWRESELRAEYERLTNALNNAIAQTKTQAQTILDEYERASNDAAVWTKIDSDLITRSRRWFDDEQTEKYPNYIQFIRSANGGSLDVAKLKARAEKAEREYNDAMAKANAVVATTDKNETQILRDLLSKKPTQANPADTITAELLAEIKRLANASGKRTQEQRDNEAEFCKEYGITQGDDMTFEQANANRGNPNYAPKYIHDDNGIYRDRDTGERLSRNPAYKKRYTINCQSCVVANELRRRGMDVAARGNTKGSMPERVSHKTNMVWKDENGKMPDKTICRGYKPGTYVVERDIMMKEFRDATKDVGRYHINWVWKGGVSGHIITAERLRDGTLRIYDPQNGEIITDFDTYANDFSLAYGISVLRVDTLQIDIAVVKEILEKPKKTRKRK